MTALTTPPAGDRQHVPTDQPAPERATITIWAKPSRHEITQWANSALRNSEIEYIDEALIEDFADGLSALCADLAAPSAPAEVEVLVADLSSCDTGMINLPIGYGEVRARIRKAITTLTALQDRVAFLEASEHGLLGRLETCRQDEAKLKAENERLLAENERAWIERNRAQSKVDAWNSVVVASAMPIRFAPGTGWGPGGNDEVSVPHVTTERLTEILDRMTALQSRAEKAEAERAAWKAIAKELDSLLEGAVSYSPMASRTDVQWVDRKKKARAAYAKLKGEV